MGLQVRSKLIDTLVALGRWQVDILDLFRWDVVPQDDWTPVCLINHRMTIAIEVHKCHRLYVVSPLLEKPNILWLGEDTASLG